MCGCAAIVTMSLGSGSACVVGLIMLLLGSGPVKGFAVVLLIGIATSVFTAVTFTRMLVARWLRANRPATIHI